MTAQTAPATNPQPPQLAKVSKFRLTPRRKLFVEYYLTTAQRVASEAARQAGFGSPRSVGCKLVKQLAEVIAAEEVAIRERAHISADEVQQRLAILARDPLHKDHYRALELMAKIHGLMSDKLDITLTKKELQNEIGAAMGHLAAIASRKSPQLPSANSAAANDS